MYLGTDIIRRVYMSLLEMWLMASSTMSGPVPRKSKEETLEDRKKSFLRMKESSIDDKVKMFDEGKVIYGEDKDEFLKIVDIVSKHLDVDLTDELSRRYVTMGISNWYLSQKVLRNGNRAVVLSASCTSNDDPIEYVDFDTDDGVFSYVHNIDVPMFSECGSVFFKWGTDSFLPRKWGE